MEHNVPIIVIDLDARVVNRCQQLGHYAIHGSCDSQPVLQAARVKSARLMVISTGYPVSSLVTAQVALQLNPELDVVARVHWRKEGDQFQRIGVKEVVWPEMEGGLEILRHSLHRCGVEPGEVISAMSESRSTTSRDSTDIIFNPAAPEVTTIGEGESPRWPGRRFWYQLQ